MKISINYFFLEVTQKKKVILHPFFYSSAQCLARVRLAKRVWIKKRRLFDLFLLFDFIGQNTTGDK